MLKRFFNFVLLFLMLFSIFACEKKDESVKYSSVDSPNTKVNNNEVNLNFVDMHNSVIDYISSEVTPFFYIKNGEFDISGDNEKKYIKVTCKCITGTTVKDLDLFLSMVLNGIGANSAEQDYRFETPTVGEDGSYTDFGTVFKMYDLIIYAETEKGDILRNDNIKAGQSIPIDPRYIME